MKASYHCTSKPFAVPIYFTSPLVSVRHGSDVGEDEFSLKLGTALTVAPDDEVVDNTAARQLPYGKYCLDNPAWYDSEACLYNLTLRARSSLSRLPTLARIDRRLYGPDGCDRRGDYTRLRDEDEATLE